MFYLRLAWAYLEPEEGRFNWSVVDTPAQRWIAKGKKVALRFTTSETGQLYATPEWVRKAGAQGTFTKNRQVVTEGGTPFSPSTTTLRVRKPAINGSRTQRASARPAIRPA